MKNEILPSIDYIHHRTGKVIDIFLLGYIKPKKHGDVEVFVPGEPQKDGQLYIDAYDAERFAEVISELEDNTNWKYDGDTELLIMYSYAAKVLRPKVGQSDVSEEAIGIFLDFSSVVSIRLEQSIEAKMITSALSFIETVVRSADHPDDYNYLEEVSNHFVLKEGKRGILKAIAAWLKVDLTSIENVASTHIVDIRKNFKANQPGKMMMHRYFERKS